MRLVNKNILLISPESWGGNFVSKHHYAKELAKTGNSVFFLNGPSNCFSIKMINDNLSVVDYKPKFRGLGKLPKLLSGYLIRREIKVLEKLLGVRFDVIWNFDSSRFFNISFIKDKLKICHIVDLSENFQRALLASTSDFCFCTSDFIADELKPFNDKVYKIHHGYKLPEKIVEVEEQFDSNKIQVGYVGNLSRPCIDWHLIFELITAHSHIQFNFIGSVNVSNLSEKSLEIERLSYLQNQTNVTLLGQKNSRLIPSYLDCFDVLLCAYKLDSQIDIKQHSNLHKLMEYIGSGKVIVSSYVDEYKDKLDLIEMVNCKKDFFNTFQRVVNKLSFYNSVEKIEERKKFAKANTYQKQLEKIEGCLED